VKGGDEEWKLDKGDCVSVCLKAMDSYPSFNRTLPIPPAFHNQQKRI
jgi:hypothetical protein